MKKQVFYIHGGEAFSDYSTFLDNLRKKPIRNLPEQESISKWTSSLSDDLGPDYEVFMPKMPNSENAKYEEWKIWFERHFEYLHDGAILIGYSQGGMFLAKYLSENETPFTIRALYLLAAPYEFFEIEGEDGGDFYPAIGNIPLLEERVKHIIIMHSKDDFVVPYEHALKYSKTLSSAELLSFENKNHFLIEEFPELVEKVKELS